MSIMRIEIDNTGAGAVRFYINGTLVATHTTNIPAAATRLGYHVGGTLSAATATNIWVDYLRVWSDDPPLSASPVETFITTSPIISSETTLKLVFSLNITFIVGNIRSISLV